MTGFFFFVNRHMTKMVQCWSTTSSSSPRDKQYISHLFTLKVMRLLSLHHSPPICPFEKLSYTLHTYIHKTVWPLVLAL